MPLLKPVSRDTLTAQAITTIKRYILEQPVEVGAKLPSERELCEMLAISRNIVREALSVLVAEGIITKQVGKGIYVSEFDRAEALARLNGTLSIGVSAVSIYELREARAALELGAAGLIVQRITDEEVQTLIDIVNSHQKKADEGIRTTKEDIDFHLVLLKAAKNPVIEEMAPLVVEMFRRTIVETSFAKPPPVERVISEHWRIIKALQQRDLDAVRTAMHQHYYLQDFPF